MNQKDEQMNISSLLLLFSSSSDRKTCSVAISTVLRFLSYRRILRFVGTRDDIWPPNGSSLF